MRRSLLRFGECAGFACDTRWRGGKTLRESIPPTRDLLERAFIEKDFAPIKMNGSENSAER